MERKMARAKTFQQDMQNEFLKRIGEGRSARSVCTDKDMPSWSQVSRELNQNTQFAGAYSLAMESRGQVYADKISEIIDQVVNGTLDANAGRVAIDGLKWVSSKLAPKVYGDVQRMEVKHETSYVDALKEVQAHIEEEGRIEKSQVDTLRVREVKGSQNVH